MEMLILAMVCAYVVKNGAVDVIHALNGQTSPRRQAVRSRVPSGAATKFFSQLWHDSWDDALTRHNQRRAGQRPQARPDKPRSAARVFWSGFGQDARRAARRRWDQGWVSLDEKRRSRTTRVPDGTVVVPGEVVPEPAVPAEPEPVPAGEPETSTEPRIGTDPTDTPLPDRDRDPIKDCRNCHGDNRVDFGSLHHTRDRYCVLSDRAPQSHDQSTPEDELNLYDTDNVTVGPDWNLQYELAARRAMNRHITAQQPRTQEGTPTMTAMPTTEVVGLDQAISYCEASAVAHREQIVVIERTRAALDMGDVSGPAAGFLSQAMEANATCQTAMENAAAELAKQKVIQEQYDAVQGAGTREFITGGR